MTQRLSKLAATAVLVLMILILRHPADAQEKPEDKKVDAKSICQKFQESIVLVRVYLPENEDKLEDYLDWAEEDEDMDYMHSRYSAYSMEYSAAFTGYSPILTEGILGIRPDLETLITSRKPLILQGTVVSEDGLVLTADPLLPLEAYEKIEFIFLDGSKVEARLDGFLSNHPGVFFKAKASEKKFSPVAFADAPAMEFGTAFKTLRLRKDGRDWGLAFDGGEITFFSGRDKTEFEEALPGSGALLLNKSGEAFGLSLDHPVWTTDAGSRSWSGKDILADKRISANELGKTLATLRQTGTKEMIQVKLEIRGGDRFSRWDEEEDDDDMERTSEKSIFGFLLDDKGRIFLPGHLDDEMIKNIHKSSVEDKNKAFEARFVGVMKDFGGLLFDCPELAGRKPAKLSTVQAFAKGVGVFSLKTGEKFGRRHSVARLNRVHSFFIEEATLNNPERAYAVPLEGMNNGDLLLDAEGGIIGFYGQEKIWQKKKGAGRVPRWMRDEPENTKYELRPKLFLFREAQESLANPEKMADPDVFPKTKKESKQLVWLGVEFQGIGKNLAKYLSIQRETKDGSMGLLVNQVYEDSPAGKLGLQKDDILLSYTEKPGGKKVDLKSEDDFGPWGGRGMEGRRNELTNLLTAIGPGKIITLQYLRGKENKEADVTLELAPPDQETAEKYQSKDLGFTAKEITYELRALLRLDKNHKGVNISRIERGSKAEVGKLSGGILEKINDEAVNNTTDLRRILESHKAEGTGTLTLFVRTLNETKFYDVHTGWDLGE